MSRGERRARTDKVTARRAKAWAVIYKWRSVIAEPHRFARKSPFGCPDGVACMLCHGNKLVGYSAERQRARLDIASDDGG